MVNKLNLSKLLLVTLTALFMVSQVSAASGGSIEKKKGYFQTPNSAPGEVFVNTGFDADLITFRVTSTNSQFNQTEDYTSSNGGGDFGIGHGFAECTGNSCNEVAQADASGSSSTNGHVTASTNSYSVFQPVTDSNGDNFLGFVNGTVAETNSTGFNVSFDSFEEQTYVIYTAYQFSSAADVDVGSFQTKTSTGTQSIDTGINPNFVHTVTSPTIENMGYFESTGKGGKDHGWNLGWAAKRPGENIEQISMTTTQYSNNPDSHVWSSSNSQLLDPLWKQDTGDINGRLDAEITSFESSGFELDYSTVNPDTEDGSRFLVTYFAVDTNGEPDVGFSETATSTGEKFTETDAELDSINLFASNTVPDPNSEGFSGNNNGNNHWGWMFGGGNKSSQRSIGFGTHSNSVNGHSAASSNFSAFRLLYTNQNGEILGEDRAQITEINETGFKLDWEEVATTSTSNVRFDDVAFAYYGFSQPDYRESEYLKTYRNDKPRGYFHESQNVTLETRGDFSEVPDISISNGTHKVGGGEMENQSGIYRYNYTVNSTKGWYNVSVGGEGWQNVFYRGEIWQDNYTDGEGNEYSFRKKINFTETAEVNRWFDPISKNISFEYGPSNNSVRVVSYNGSKNLEIPSQLLDQQKNGGDLKWADITFLTSFNRSEERDYYVMSAKKNYSRDYESGIELSSSTDLENFTGRTYSSVFDKSAGGLMEDLKNLVGTQELLGGQSPMDRYPEVQIGLNTIAVRQESDPVFEISEGPVLTEIEISGNASEDASKPYEISCDLYSGTDYYTCEKNFSTTNSEEFKNFFMNGLLFEDGRMEYASYREPSGISSESLTGGNGNDISGINSETDWIAFYSNFTSDGVAEIFLNKSFDTTDQEEFRIFDDGSNDYFQQQVIDSTSVSADESFYTETARLIYPGLQNYTAVNDTYTILENPLNFTEGSEETNDEEKPELLNNYSVGTEDNGSVEFKTLWQDDSFLNTAEINVTGNGVNGSETVLKYEESREIGNGEFVNKSWVNVTLPPSEVNAGEVEANITLKDISGKTNTSITDASLTDNTPPAFTSVVNEPDTEAELDPGIQVNITANLTEYSSISNASLYHRKYDESSGTWKDYNITNMSYQSSDDFKDKYVSNFTAEGPGNFSYFVEAEDNKGNSNNSSETNLLIENDTTWKINPEFEDTTDTFDQNTSAGNFTLNNTGDGKILFNLTADFSERIWLNDTSTPFTKTLSAGEHTFYNLTAKTRAAGESEGTDKFTVTVENNTAEPESNSSSFIVTTSTGGPFLDPDITAFDPEVTQGDDEIRLEAETVNRGNETANETFGEFILPEGWSVSSGNDTRSDNFTLDPDQSFSFETYVDVLESAETGNVEIEYSTDSNNSSARSDLETVKVNELSTDDSESPESSGGGGGGGGSSGSSGGGGGFAGLGGGEEEPETLVRNETTEVELVRGRATGFSFEFVNPFKDARLEDVSINASGLLSQYIEYSPSKIEEIPANESLEVEVSVTAPEYFDIGTHKLYFDLKGVKNSTSIREQGNITITSGESERLSSQKEVTVYVREYSTENASKFLERSREIYKRIQSYEVRLRNSEELLDKAENGFENRDYSQVKEARDQLRNTLQSLQETDENIEELEKDVVKAERRGIKVEQTSRMVRLAEQARERGDLQTAESRLEEARSLYQLETKGAFNLIFFLQSNWKILSALSFFGLLAGSGFLVIFRLKWLERKIENLERREKALHEKMVESQEKALAGGELSLDEYEEKFDDFATELTATLEQRMAMEAKRAGLLKLGRAEKQLKIERDKLIQMMEKDQRRYYESKDISKRIFEERSESLQERLSEVEEEIAEIKTSKGFLPKLVRLPGYV